MTTIIEHFRSVVSAQPDDVAMTTPHARYTYADLDRWSDAIAADVIAQNAPLDRPVAIVTRDNVALVPAVMGVVKAGHYFVMIDAADPDERVAMLLRESSAVLRLADIPPLPTGSVPRPPERPPHPYVYVIYTSGTTGKPKGILAKQDGFVEGVLVQGRRWGRGRGERSIYTSLPGFIRAANNIFGTLLCGATMCAFDARNESLTALADYIRRERITILGLTPPLFRRLMTLPADELDLSSVRTLRIGADVVTIADVETFKARFPRTCTLARGYASSETGPVFQMQITHDTPIPGPLVPMGKPYADVEVWLLDEHGCEVADGEVGELVVRSAGVVDGYWNAPELTAERFTIDRRFFTGDLAKRDADGLYYFIGRRDSRLKIHGRRIDPLEIESALLATGEVAEAVIVGKPDARGETRLVAYVVMRDRKPCVPRELRAALRAKLPSWMVPARIFALDTLPMTRAAKADRAALLARIDAEPIAEESGASDELEEQLVEIWADVLGTAVRIDDDFFDDLGGESILAAHLVTKLEHDLGRAIPLSLIVELNTVRKMAAYFRTAGAEKPLAIALQSGGSLPPLFCVAGAGGGVVRFRALAAAMGEERPVYGLQPHGFDLDNFPTSYADIVASYADAIRQIQPHGPYYLSGYSSGGAMAFALARHFELAGEPVAFVGVIDSTRRTQPIAAWRRAVNRVTLLVADPRRARRLPREVALRTSLWVKARLRRRITDAEKPLPPWLRDTRFAMREAKRDDAHGHFTGPVTLFRARDGMRRTRREQDLGWSEFAIGGLQIIDVDGDHDSILGDHVQSLGKAMAAALSQAWSAGVPAGWPGGVPPPPR
jgi:acyl-coenzyme A synthetase/AMP-(fatty) acid ligase/thioesterase domain-containing protein/acyl carrier protein